MKRQQFRYWSRYTREYLYEPRKYASMTSLIVVIVIILLYFFGFKPTLAEMNEKNANLVTRKAQLESINDYLGNIQSLKPLLQEASVNRNKLKDSIPEDSRLPDFMEHLSYTAAVAGIQLDSLTPEPNLNKNGQYEETKLKVAFKGDVQNALKLVKALEEDTRFIGIKALSVSQESTEDQGLVDMTLVIYYLSK